MTDFDEAVEVLESGSRDDVLSLLLGLTEKERKALGPKFRRWLTHGSTTRASRDRESLAVIATAGGVRQAAVSVTSGWGLDRAFLEDAVRILEERSPAWLPDFAEAVLEDPGTWEWRLARALVAADLVPVPESPDYYRGTVRGVSDYDLRNRQPLIDELARDPGLIGDHLIGMLSTEGAGRLLAYHDHFQESSYDYLPDHTPFSAGTWRETLLLLARDGRLDRRRLLETVLAAPLRDWAQADLGWFATLHAALEPTLDEVVELQSTYARLLTVEHGPSVKLAQQQITRILDDPRFAPGAVVDASFATLGRSDKAAVAAQLRLLEKLHKAHPDPSVLAAMATAVDHPRSDIRDRATKLIEKLGGDVADSPPEVFEPSVPMPRPLSRPVEPVVSADALAEVLLGLLEQVDAVELERAVDGLLRLADERPTTTEVLLRRAGEVELYQDDPRVAASVLARAWLTPRKWLFDGEWPIVLGHSSFPGRAASPHTLVGAVGRRLTGVAQAVRRGPHTAVALPTAADGSLDADTLSARLAGVQRRREPPELELALALLRVAPDQRDQVALPGWMRRNRVVERVLTLPAHEWEREVVTYQRMTWEPEHTVPAFRDRAGLEGDPLDGILARRRVDDTLGEETSYGDYEPGFEQTLAVAALMLPHDHDVLAAHAHPYLHRDLRKERAVSVPVLEAIAQARRPHGAPGSSALALGLAAKDARGRTAAQDALLDLARHGVLDGAGLGRQIALLLGDDIVVGQRISLGLTEVARADDAAAVPVLDALQELMAALVDRRDAGAFVELAADLAERTGRTVRLPAELVDLAAGRSTSMVARAARRLLQGA